MNGGGAERHRKMTMNQGWLAAGGGEDGHPSNTKKLDELPERFINRYVLVLTVALMTVRGLGVLAFAWSTVVLLGGFVTLLGRLDFWFITLISFAQSARIFGAVADEQYLYFVELLSRPIIGTAKRMLNQVCCGNKKQSATTPQRSYEESNEEPRACCNRFPSLGMKDATTMLIKIGLPIPLVLVVLHPVFVLFNIVASFVRLWRKDYGQEANLKPAVVIFYSLAFSQGVLYLLWLILDVGKVLPVRLVVQKYGFHGTWSTQYVRRYLIDTKFKCLKDLSAIKGRNLITYASGLLDSDYMKDYLCGERILVYFIEREMLPRQDLIRSSRKRIQKLIMMLSWTDEHYQEIRLLASKIVAHVAGHVSIAQFPGTLESVSSLLDPSENNHILFRSSSSPDRRGNDADHTVQIKIDDAHGRQECQLIEHGLIILHKFTLDTNNCIEMCKSDVLIMHILAWICSKPFIPVNEQAEWIDILTRSFKVLNQLTSVRGQAGNEVRKKVKFELEPSWINGYGSHPEIQMLAIDLHMQVFLKHFEEPQEFIINNSNSDKHKQNKPSPKSDKRENFLMVILNIFLSYKDMENEGIGSVASRKVQVKAGEAIAMVSAEEKNYEAMLKVKGDIVIELYHIIFSKTEIEYRAIAADIFKRFYANAVREPKEVLQKVLDLLQTSMESETLGNGDLPVYPDSSKHPDSKCNQQNYVKRLQAALLRIICVIHRSRQITAKDLVDVVGSVSYKSCYVGLLKELVDRNKRGTTAYPIEIVKWAAMIVDLMIQSKTELVQQIREEGIVDSLIEASNIMSGVDSWTIFRHIHRRGVVWNQTLAEIVKDIKNRTY